MDDIEDTTEVVTIALGWSIYNALTGEVITSGLASEPIK